MGRRRAGDGGRRLEDGGDGGDGGWMMEEMVDGGDGGWRMEDGSRKEGYCTPVACNSLFVADDNSNPFPSSVMPFSLMFV
jgi:hypothetical protein